MNTRSATKAHHKHCDFFLCSTLMSKEAATTVKHSQFKKTLHFKAHLEVWERKDENQDFTAHGLVPVPQRIPSGLSGRAGVCAQWQTHAEPSLSEAWALLPRLREVGRGAHNVPGFSSPPAPMAPDMITPRAEGKHWFSMF